MILYAIGLFIFAKANGSALLFIAISVMALALALYSGSPKAWFYDLLIDYNQESNRDSILPKMNGVVKMFAILANIISFILVSYSIRWPLFLASGISLLSGFLYLLLFEDNKGNTNGKSFLNAVVVFTKEFLSDTKMRNIVLYNGKSYIAYTFFILEWQLVLVNKYKVENKYISIILIMFMGSMMLGSFLTAKLLKKYKKFSVTKIGKLGIGISLLLMIFFSNMYVCIIAMILLEISLAVADVPESIWVNDFISSDNRATYYSGLSSALKVFGFIILVISGTLIDKLGYEAGWLAVFGGNIISVLVLNYFVRKFGEKVKSE